MQIFVSLNLYNIITVLEFNVQLSYFNVKRHLKRQLGSLIDVLFIQFKNHIHRQ